MTPTSLINNIAETRQGGNSMNEPIKINLQLFAEELEETNLDNESNETEDSGDPFERLYKMNDKKPTEVEVEAEKPVDKQEDKKIEDAKTEPDTKELEDKQSEKFITVRHLGKEVQIPLSERDKYLQMGYDYPHVKDEAKKVKDLLQRTARLNGFEKVEDYIADLDRIEKEKMIEKIENAYGDPVEIENIIKTHPLILQTQEEKQRLDDEKRKMDYEKRIDSLKKEPFFKELEPELNQLLEQNPNVDPNLAYSVIVGNYFRTGKLKDFEQKAIDQVAKAKEATEKKVTADFHDKERRSTPTGGDSNEGSEYVQSTSFGNKLADIFGLSKEARKTVAQETHQKLKRS